MNKSELINHMAKISKLSKTDCKKALEAFIKTVTQTVKANKPVVLTGFGTYALVKRKGRMGVNPSTGAKMQIPAKKVVKFRPGKALRESVAK